MRSYLKVQMDKGFNQPADSLKGIQAIERVSKQSQDQMISIVQQLENLSNNQLEKMQRSVGELSRKPRCKSKRD